MLSPFNKVEDGFDQYCEKRKAILAQKVHLAELDFLVGGNRKPLCKSLPKGDFHYLLTRAETRAHCQICSWSVRHRLPILPIPLRVPDPDIRMDLQQVFETTYQRGRYARSLPYGKPPFANLYSEEKIWAADLSSKKP
jgi:hypothetical protein